MSELIVTCSLSAPSELFYSSLNSLLMYLFSHANFNKHQKRVNNKYYSSSQWNTQPWRLKIIKIANLNKRFIQSWIIVMSRTHSHGILGGQGEMPPTLSGKNQQHLNALFRFHSIIKAIAREQITASPNFVIFSHHNQIMNDD